MAKKESISALAQPYAGSTRSKTSINRQLAQELLDQYESNGTFTIPVKDFNEMIGIGDSTARAWQIKRLLNKQHIDLLDESKEWRVGQTAQNTMYVFSLGARRED
jgi:hypothetical protein